MLAASVADRAKQYASLGMTPAVAEVARAANEEMGRCILSLYPRPLSPPWPGWESG
jgi:hypothetical protein